MERRRRKCVCDRRMDLFLLVNQISRGGAGDAVVAPLAYFPPFTSHFILLGTLEVQYMPAVQARLACHHKTAEKWLHSRGWGGGSSSAHLLYIKREQGQKRSSHLLFPSLHSLVLLALQTQRMFLLCRSFHHILVLKLCFSFSLFPDCLLIPF